MRKFFAVAALLAVAAVSPRQARADGDVGGWVTKVVEALRAENPGELINLINEGDKDTLVTMPAETWRLAKGAAKYIPRWGLGEYHEIAEKVAAWLDKLAPDVKKAAPDDPRTKRTIAAIHATKARLEVVREGQVSPDDWVAAADGIIESYGTDAGADGGEAAGLAAAWLRDGSVLTGMDLAALTSKIDPLTKILEPLPAAQVADMAKAQLRLLKAALVPKEVKASIDGFFAVMEPYAKAGCEMPIATLYNEGVTFAKSKKVPTKNDYLMAAKSAGMTNVTFQLIQSDRWKSFTGDDRVLGGFNEFDVYGRKMREVAIELYRWDYNYIDPDGKKFGGDNAKGLARMWQNMHKDKFSKITSNKDLVKGMFAKNMPASEFFDIQGVDSSNLPLRVRVHLVKAKEAAATYGISIFDYGKMPEGDPEMKEVLDTFAEVPKKKK